MIKHSPDMGSGIDHPIARGEIPFHYVEPSDVHGRFTGQILKVFQIPLDQPVHPQLRR